MGRASVHFSLEVNDVDWWGVFEDLLQGGRLPDVSPAMVEGGTTLFEALGARGLVGCSAPNGLEYGVW